MKTYSKQWRTLNTSWPENCDLIDIVYQPPDKEGFVVYNVGFFVNRYGSAIFKKGDIEYQDDYITGWKHVQE